MNGRGFLPAFAILVAMLFSAIPGRASPVTEDNVVIIFPFKTSGLKISRQQNADLRSYMGTRLTMGRVYGFVPEQQIAGELGKAKLESFKDCYDDLCRIDLTKKMAAHKGLVIEVAKESDGCRITANIFDLKTEVSESAADVVSGCDMEALRQGLRQVADILAGHRNGNADSVRTAPVTVKKSGGDQDELPPYEALKADARRSKHSGRSNRNGNDSEDTFKSAYRAQVLAAEYTEAKKKVAGATALMASGFITGALFLISGGVLATKEDPLNGIGYGLLAGGTVGAIFGIAGAIMYPGAKRRVNELAEKMSWNALPSTGSMMVRNLEIPDGKRSGYPGTVVFGWSGTF